MTTSSRVDPEVLFTWLHVSDIHVGHGAANTHWDQKLVLQALRADLTRPTATGVAKPDLVFITGDVAFSGDEKKPGQVGNEYRDAGAWVDSVVATLGLQLQDVYIVPGNHDVQRPQDADKNRHRLVDSIRNGASIDDALEDTADAALLAARFKNFSDFANKYGNATPDTFWVRSRITKVGGISIRIAGLNSALVARDDSDLGKLQVGIKQVGMSVLEPKADEVIVILSHHPLADGWLRDQDEVATWVRSHAHVHLSGHVHEANSENLRAGALDHFVRVVAGAAHGDATAPVVNHGYNIASLVRYAEGRLSLRIWPRRWSAKNKRFVVDVDNVPEPHFFAEHPITLTALPTTARPARASSPSAKSVIWPDELDPQTIPLDDLVAAIEKVTGTKVEVVISRPTKTSIWIKVIRVPLEQLKRTMLSIACLVAGNTQADFIDVGMANTTELRNGTGDTEFLFLRFRFPADKVQSIARSKEVPPDFWSSVVFVLLNEDNTPFARETLVPFAEWEASL
ncbi:MAG: hypothetical protein JWR83_2778 [Aeromicrobium sp.]|nr:hypothetical protein [Aeromicrobium sp.]